MNAIQMNAEMLRNLSIIAEDEHLLRRAAKFLRKLVKEKEDPTLMTKEEFFAKIEESERQIERGECHTMLPGEDLTLFLRRVGYDL